MFFSLRWCCCCIYQFPIISSPLRKTTATPTTNNCVCIIKCGFKFYGVHLHVVTYPFDGDGDGDGCNEKSNTTINTLILLRCIYRFTVHNTHNVSQVKKWIIEWGFQMAYFIQVKKGHGFGSLVVISMPRLLKSLLGLFVHVKF